MDQNANITYIDIRDAAELTGYAVKHLRRLIKASEIRHYKAEKSIMVAWPDVKGLATHQKPFWVALPDRARLSDRPDPNLLLHTETEDIQVVYPEDHFRNKVEVGNCIDIMRRMPSGIAQSVVTSPPYWGTRKYPGQQAVTWSDGSTIGFGEESRVEEYVSHTLEVLRHLKRVLRDDGTIWWNMGDTYQTRAYLRSSSVERIRAFEGDRSDTWSKYPHKRYSSGHPYLKDKDLTMVPFMVGIGAEHLGFYVRSVIVWHKDNVGPDSAKDRPTPVHEYILLLAKSRFYKYNVEAETERAITGQVMHRIKGSDKHKIVKRRKLRTVWQFPTSGKHGGHTAAFPLELPLRCLRLSTTPGDLVFDPFAGSGTALAAAKILDCYYYGCDVVEEFVQDAKRRLASPTQPLTSRKRQSVEEIAYQARLVEKPTDYDSNQ